MCAIILAGVIALSTAAHSQSTKAADDPDQWQFSVAAYGWLINVGGNVTARNHTIDTSASFIDLVQKSDSLTALMTYVEADKRPVGFYTDVVFAKLGFGAGQTRYRNPVPGVSISTTASAALTYQLLIVEMGGVYEIYRSTNSAESSTAIDGVLGFRYWNNSTAAAFDVAATVDVPSFGLQRSFGTAIARSDAIQWVDPAIGLRLRQKFTAHQHIVLRGDIGGFGLGSQFSWQAVAVYSHAWHLEGGQQLAALLGFRALGVNYASGAGLDRVGINEVFYGPIIGASIRF